MRIDINHSKSLMHHNLLYKLCPSGECMGMGGNKDMVGGLMHSCGGT